MTWVEHVAAKRISRFLKRKQNPARLTQDLQDKYLLSGIFGMKEGLEKRAGATVNPKSSRASPRVAGPSTTTTLPQEQGCTYARRRPGPADPSRGAGSRRACTACSCVPQCCAGSRHKPPRWCSPWPCTRPCRNGTAWSGRCSCTL